MLYRRKIEKYIKKGQYEKALDMINKGLIPKNSNRICLNLKAKCLLGLGKIEEADQLFRLYNPFSIVDEISLESIQLLIEIKKHTNLIEAERYRFCESVLLKKVPNNKIQRLLNIFNDITKKLLLQGDSYLQQEDVINSLLECSYMLNRFLDVAVYYAYAKKVGIFIEEKLEKNILSKIQLVDFSNSLLEKFNFEACIIDDFINIKDSNRTIPLVFALSKCFGKVHYLCNKNIKNYLFLPNIHAIEINYKEEENLNEIIKKLKEICYGNKTGFPCFLFANADYLMNVNEYDSMYKLLEMHYRHYEEISDNHYDCLLLCDYLCAASYVMKIDAKKMIYRQPSIDFSIIIPVRNNAKYLSQELKTCLEQSFNGTFEILISDNSDIGNTNVRRCVNSFSDKRIRYIHTPFVLSLTKSFEFAYLNAKGRYLISLGVDDGLMKNALSILKDITKKYDKYDVIQCNRYMYFWKGYNFFKESQSNVLHYSYPINRNIIICERETQSLRHAAIRCEIPDILLPYMYQQIVKKSYLIKLYEKTGKIGYGDSQDVYNGMVNLFLEDKFLYINIPLIIAGNSSAGVGFGSYQYSIEHFCNHYGNVKDNYRYNNYFNKRYRQWHTFLIPYGTITLMYREFLKIDNMNLTSFPYWKDSNDFIILKKILSAIPIEISDEELIYTQLKKIAKLNGKQMYNSLCKEITKKQRNKIFIICNENLKNFLKKNHHIYNGVKKLKKILGNKDNCIECDKFYINGIFDISQFIYSLIESDVKELYNQLESNNELLKY